MSNKYGSCSKAKAQGVLPVVEVLSELQSILWDLDRDFSVVCFKGERRSDVWRQAFGLGCDRGMIVAFEQPQGAVIARLTEKGLVTKARVACATAANDGCRDGGGSW